VTADPDPPDGRFPLPPYAHVPGRNRRHPAALFAMAKAAVPDRTGSEAASENPVWWFGLLLLARGYYWECHEVLEPVWQNAAPNSRERQFVQGVIQLANAALKREMGRPRAARRLCAMARDHFRAAAGDDLMVMGCVPADAYGAAGDLEQAIASDGPVELDIVPTRSGADSG